MKLLLIEWVDSRGATGEWHTLEGDRSKQGICRMRSVGWVISENDEHVTLAPHMGIEDDDDHQVCGVMWIPKICITKFDVLKEADK